MPALPRRVVELAAVLLIGVSLARIFGAVVFPLPVSTAPPIAPPSAPQKQVVIVNPFGEPLIDALEAGADAGDSTVNAADTSLNLTLYGTWVDSQNASALIGQDDSPQKVYRIGDEICCGARLEKVFATHVLINRDGVFEALRLANKYGQSGDAAQGGAPPAVEVEGSQVGGDLSSILSVQPTVSPSGALEFAVSPAGDPERFAELGLQEGDVIVSINGRAAPTTAEAVPAYLESLRGASEFSVVLRRSGSTVEVDFTLSIAARGQEG